MRRLIVNTPASGLNVLGVGGVPIINAHRQIRSVLEQKLGPRHAKLLSEPKRAGSTGPIDWYTDYDGDIRKLTALSDEEQAATRAKRDALIADVRRYAEALSDRQLATRLQNAVSYPSEEFVYVVGDDVVLVCWGATTELPDRNQGELIKEVDARSRPLADSAHQAVRREPEPTFVSAPVVVRESFPWLALLFLMLFTGLVWSMILALVPACGVRIFDRTIGWCTVQTAAAASPDTGETQALERELAALRQRVAALATCPAPKRAEVPPAKEVDQELAKRKDEQRAQEGEVSVTLIWDGTEDLDLKVTCPSGQTIYHGQKVACGGELDVDMNHGTNHSSRPIENIFFKTGAAQRGTYIVRVRNFSDASRRVGFTVVVKVRGTEKKFTGAVDGKVEVETGSFTVD